MRGKVCIGNDFLSRASAECRNTACGLIVALQFHVTECRLRKLVQILRTKTRSIVTCSLILVEFIYINLEVHIYCTKKNKENCKPLCLN